MRSVNRFSKHVEGAYAELKWGWRKQSSKKTLELSLRVYADLNSNSYAPQKQYPSDFGSNYRSLISGLSPDQKRGNEVNPSP